MKVSKCHEFLSHQVNRHIKYYGLCLYTESRQTLTSGGGEHDRFAIFSTLRTAKTITLSFSNSLSLWILRLFAALKHGLYKTLSFFMALQSIGPWPLLWLVISRYLHTEHKHRISTHRHPCHKWGSNSQPQCLNGRRGSYLRPCCHCNLLIQNHNAT
jgi:hypothetical protein